MTQDHAATCDLADCPTCFPLVEEWPEERAKECELDLNSILAQLGEVQEQVAILGRKLRELTRAAEVLRGRLRRLRAAEVLRGSLRRLRE